MWVRRRGRKRHTKRERERDKQRGKKKNEREGEKRVERKKRVSSHEKKEKYYLNDFKATILYIVSAVAVALSPHVTQLYWMLCNTNP